MANSYNINKRPKDDNSEDESMYNNIFCARKIKYWNLWVQYHIKRDDIGCKDSIKTSALQQRIMMKRLGLPLQIVKESWYPIDKKWYDSWIKYTMYDKGDQDIRGGIENLDKNTELRPGKIDNSALKSMHVFPWSESVIKLVGFLRNN